MPAFPEKVLMVVVECAERAARAHRRTLRPRRYRLRRLRFGQAAGAACRLLSGDVCDRRLIVHPAQEISCDGFDELPLDSAFASIPAAQSLENSHLLLL